jgi:ribosome-associated protein
LTEKQEHSAMHAIEPSLAIEIAGIINGKQGRDIAILDISRLSSFADYFVNATAGNTRMLEGIKDEIEKQLGVKKILPRGMEGKAPSGWILMDYGDIIVNLFLPDQRETYQIEKVWRDAALVDVEFDERR